MDNINANDKKDKFLDWLNTEIKIDTKEAERCKIVRNANKGVRLEYRVLTYEKVRKCYLMNL